MSKYVRRRNMLGFKLAYLTHLSNVIFEIPKKYIANNM